MSLETAKATPTIPAPSIQDADDLQARVRELAMLPESDAPILTCYVDLESLRGRWQPLFDHRAKLLRQITPDEDLAFLDAALEHIRTFLSTEIRPQTRGVAVFARAGQDSYFLGLQFEVPTANWIALDTVPNIYHLIELKDTFDRYLVLHSTLESARIFEVHLGAVTRELRLQQPELRRRVGREWTRLHYQNHRRDRDRGFVREKIQALGRLMQEEGYAHLILAGDPQRLAKIRRELPRTIRQRVVDVVAAPGELTGNEVVEATLSSFVEEEERESQSLSEVLIDELRRDGLAVSGVANSLQILRCGQADVLVLARNLSPIQAWSCDACIWSAAGGVEPEVCSDCGATDLREHDAREELVRLASQTGCRVELVGESEALNGFGGVGCLLRYKDWAA